MPSIMFQSQKRQGGSLLSSLPMIWSCTSGRPVDPEFGSYLPAYHRVTSNDENDVNHWQNNPQQPHPYHATFKAENDQLGLGEVQTQFPEEIRKPILSSSSPSRSQSTATTRSSTVQSSKKRRNRAKKYYSIDVPLKQQQTLQQDGGGRLSHSRLDSTATTLSTTTPSISQVESSFSDDISLLSFDYEDDLESVASAEKLKELKFWKKRASECLDRHGMVHVNTANAFFELGSAHLRCQQYAAAAEFLRTVSHIYERKFGPTDLRVAKALDALGLARSGGESMSADKAGLLIGLQSLRKCFKIRYDELGPWHIDTVETMNKISNIYLKLQWFSRAKEGFLEVVTMRTAILGNSHPSVAVATRSLGIAHLQMNEQEQAKAYFSEALNIFALSGLAKNALAEKIREDIEKLGFDESRVEI